MKTELKRQISLGPAVMLGLGSILGTGVYVSIGIAASVAGSAILLAIPIAALLALANGLSSAQLAAAFPVAGGTYEYGNRVLTPSLGFVAGWLFLCAKTASAAAASLGCAGYCLRLLGISNSAAIPFIALGTIVLLTLVAFAGISRSSRMNLIMVSITIASLSLFVAVGLPSVFRAATHSEPSTDLAGGFETSALLYAAALMFVAFTGYGRIATLGEEVIEPRKTIPRAMIVTLLVSAVLYIAVAAVLVSVVEPQELGTIARTLAAPLEAAATAMGSPAVRLAVAIGAITAMLGVLLNLILGLSRVVLAMGRRGDMPPAAAKIHHSTPTVAVIVVGIAIAATAFSAAIPSIWAFSALTVLAYYGITNLAALRLAREQRLYPRFIAAFGLVGCLTLAFWIPAPIWLAGLALVAVGLLWQAACHRWFLGRAESPAADR